MWLGYMCSAANATGNTARAFLGAIRGTFWRAPKMTALSFFATARSAAVFRSFENKTSTRQFVYPRALSGDATDLRRVGAQ